MSSIAKTLPSAHPTVRRLIRGTKASIAAFAVVALILWISGEPQLSEPCVAAAVPAKTVVTTSPSLEPPGGVLCSYTYPSGRTATAVELPTREWLALAGFALLVGAYFSRPRL